VWATLKDANGFRKERPAIVLTPTDEISADSPMVVMAVTTSFPDPPPDNHIRLPWNPDPRRVRTKLRQRSAAVIDWLDSLYPDEVIEVHGEVPPPIMAEIQRRLGAHGPDER
jgi:mRNA-degrading endonuclease toxin of MazEF toxin-antitoxin module